MSKVLGIVAIIMIASCIIAQPTNVGTNTTLRMVVPAKPVIPAKPKPRIVVPVSADSTLFNIVRRMPNDPRGGDMKLRITMNAIRNAKVAKRDKKEIMSMAKYAYSLIDSMAIKQKKEVDSLAK